ncbi:MAG: alpha-mannosidase [Niameybacter sp.]|uniref:alpha-mannosidase n=1 Tax=Niameybacter sp. TaxID=2033640 RepID=UPI002FC7C588
MFYTAERVSIITQKLKTLSKVQKHPLENWQVKFGCFNTPNEADLAPIAWDTFNSHTMHWYGPDQHYWFRTTLTVPESFDGKSLWVIIHTQIDEWDDGKNPQFLLFVNGEITQGLDMHHREVLITEHAQAGETYTLDLQSYTGTIHSEFRLIGEMVEFDPEVNALYYDLQVPLWALSRMPKGDKVRLDIEAALNATINFIDLRKPYSQDFYNSIEAAKTYIAQAIYEDLAGFDEVIATCIGHTHIDVAWLWTVAQTRQKVARSFATVLKLMDEFPQYKFMSSQPQLYYFLKERYPELYARLKEKVQEGRWEPEGGMWVEADCNLTSGESLVRQFMYGKRFFKEEFGVDNRILWLPDVFGYSAALPQIMQKCGIDYFMTTKLAWNQFDKLPFDTFKWRGIDGTEILTHFITTLGVGQSIDNFFTTYNGMLHPDALMGAWERYQNKDMNNDILIAFGYGDGGGGPTRTMLETSMRMEKGIKGVPKVRQAFAHEYFDELKERVENSQALSTWSGELYFEYHRGTYTSMARNKRSNRESENLLMNLELLSTMALSKGVAYPTTELDSMWKTVLLNQFHDILPGTSIKEVYEVTKEEYENIKAATQTLTSERLNTLAAEGEGVTLANTSGFNKESIVNLVSTTTDPIHGIANLKCATALVDAEGTLHPLQHTQEGAIVYAKDLPPKGLKGFSLSTESMPETHPFTLQDSSIHTPFYTVSIDTNGLFTSIYDKTYDRELLLAGQKGNVMKVYEDMPMCYDNWDIDIYYKQKAWEVTDLTSMTWTAVGPLRATLEIERPFVDSIIRQSIHFYTDSRRIDFETYVDWKQGQHLLKVHFPLDIHTDEATFDIQFGNLTRKTHENTSWDQARFETCAHKWVDLSEGAYGVSLLNNCKYGHSIKDTDLALTLIKSGVDPNPKTDQEEHFFTYALYPHAGTWKDAHTHEEAIKLNQPVLVANKGNVATHLSFAQVDQPNVLLETIKLAEDGSGVIIRLYEYQNMRTKATLTFANTLKAVYECDLLENELCSLSSETSSFLFGIKPYEIKTYKVVFNS